MKVKQGHLCHVSRRRGGVFSSEVSVILPPQQMFLPTLCHPPPVPCQISEQLLPKIHRFAGWLRDHRAQLKIHLYVYASVKGLHVIQLYYAWVTFTRKFVYTSACHFLPCYVGASLVRMLSVVSVRYVHMKSPLKPRIILWLGVVLPTYSKSLQFREFTLSQCNL